MNDISPEHDIKATGIETLRLMIKAGTGITFMPEIAIKEHDEGICYIPFIHPADRRSIGLVWRKTTARIEVIEKLVQLLKKI
jgi:LysR family hydrogen peroxide-inducible transcriptional activator